MQSFGAGDRSWSRQRWGPAKVPALPAWQHERLLLLAAVCRPLTALPALRELSSKSWRRQREWLDTSGLTLLLFRALTDHHAVALLPEWLQRRWETNRADNTKRMSALEEEMVQLHRDFQRLGIEYATLKGFSLHPLSVPHVEDRSQLDLDFLIAESSVPAARQHLETRGYQLRGASGRSLEFKTNEAAPASLNDLYKPLPYRCVELHVEASTTPRPLLPRISLQPWATVEMPVLQPADLFLGQGLHLYKHIASEFFRLAHLVEFRQHVVNRFADEAFWCDVQQAAGGEQTKAIGLGVAITLTEQVTGPFAPPALMAWTSDVLPPGARQWIHRYGASEAFKSFPGSKLYLILQGELERTGVQARRAKGQALIPRGLPPSIAVASPHETRRDRWMRRLRQLNFIAFRLRFHLRQGARYLYEARSWQHRRGLPPRTAPRA